MHCARTESRDSHPTPRSPPDCAHHRPRSDTAISRLHSSVSRGCKELACTPSIHCAASLSSRTASTRSDTRTVPSTPVATPLGICLPSASSVRVANQGHGMASPSPQTAGQCLGFVHARALDEQCGGLSETCCSPCPTQPWHLLPTQPFLPIPKH